MNMLGKKYNSCQKRNKKEGNKDENKYCYD